MIQNETVMMEYTRNGVLALDFTEYLLWTSPLSIFIFRFAIVTMLCWFLLYSNLNPP